MDFCDRLKLLMKENNLNQSALSKQCNISQTTISGWLRGHRPLPSALKILADYFNVSTDYLIGYTDTQYTNDQKEINEEEKQIIIKYNNAPDSIKTAVKKLLDL